MESIPISIVEPLAGAKVPSLPELDEKVKRNETLLTVYGAIIIGLIISILGAIITGVLKLGGS